MIIKKEVSKKLVELEIKNTKEAIELVPAIKEVLKKYDGKVINKRIDTALKLINKNLYLKKESYGSMIIYHFPDNCVSSKDVDGSHYPSTYYTQSGTSFCLIKPNEDGSYRLDFEAVSKLLDLNVEGRLKNVKTLETQLKNIDAILKRYNDLIKECAEFNDSVDSTLKEYYNISYLGRR